MMDWKGKRIVIIGAARQGAALARYLSARGAVVTLTDKRSTEQLTAVRQSLQEFAIQWVLGDHPLSLLDGCDLLCLSGGVSPDLPLVKAARQHGIAITNDSQLFMEAVPCPVIAITGSAGKTTTTTLLGRMAQAAVQAPRKVWVGGNIGQPLIEFVDQIQPDDIVILELSSFQLELMTLSPHIAAITNITPNHLDRHGSMPAYTAAKANILLFQTTEDVAILNREDPVSQSLTGLVRGSLVTFGMAQPLAGQSGTYMKQGKLWLQSEQAQVVLMDTTLVRLRGDHNLMNVLSACAIAHAAGFSPAVMRAGVEGFAGVAHRLEWIRTWRGAEWYNDSIATAPERTIAAIRSFSEPLVLLLGGRDKDLPWGDLAELVHQRVSHVIIFGEAAPKILAALSNLRPGAELRSIQTCEHLKEAVQAAAQVASHGDVVLLSPGGTSFDEFNDFEERGERFTAWVNQLS